MRTKIKIFLLCAAIITVHKLHADNIISFFMRPFPYLSEQKIMTKEEAKRKAKKLHQPGKIAKYTLRSILESNGASGIFCTYKGQLAFSDSNGQVSFARRQKEPRLYLMITQKINPVFDFDQLINHWETEIGFPAQMYVVEQNKDPQTGILFWKVEKAEIESNGEVPLDAVVIFAKPKHIFVPEGITIIEEKTAQLLLPDIYVKKHVDKLGNSLYVLNLKRFFSPPRRTYQIKEKLYQEQLY